MVKAKTLILIDGHALAYRMFFALERTRMRTKDGTPTFMVYGFLKALFDMLKDIEPEAIAVSFDMGRDTFRLEKYSEYKANREAAPDGLKEQMLMLNTAIKALNIPIYKLKGFEADDVIGTIARKAKELGHKTLILTGDRDSFQLVDKEEFIKILIPVKNELVTYDRAGVFERMGIYPEQVVDYKALCGDTSDNIPGVKGIGDKTTVKLLSEFGTLEGVYENLDNIKSKSQKQKLIDGREMADMSRFLAQIDLNVPIEFDFEHTHLETPKIEEFREFLTKMQFKSMLAEFPKLMALFGAEVKEEIETQDYQPHGQMSLFSSNNNPAPQVAKIEKNYKTISSNDELNDLIEDLEKTEIFALDTETTSVNALEAKLVGISVAFRPPSRHPEERSDVRISNTDNHGDPHVGRLCLPLQDDVLSFYIPTGHIAGDNFPQAISKLKPILENPNIKKILQNAKYEIHVLKNYDIDLQGVVMDTMLASYVKNPVDKHGLKQQASHLLDFEMNPIETLIGKGKNQLTMDMVAVEDCAKYACDDALATFMLGEYYEKNLDEKEKNLLNTIELPLVNVLAKMERAGISVDIPYLKTLSIELDKKIIDIEKKIFDIAGFEFNIASPKQVAEALFERLKLPSGAKTKTGYSTSAKILEDLARHHEIAGFILEQRHFAKLKSTYVDSLPELIGIDGRIHTSFNQAVTTTGRLSSNNPNLQNIPIRTEIGAKIRKAFVAKSTSLHKKCHSEFISESVTHEKITNNTGQIPDQVRNDMGEVQNDLGIVRKDNTVSNDGLVLLSADYSQIELRLLAHFSEDENLLKAYNDDIDIHTLTASKVFGVPVESVTKEMRYNAKAVNFGIIYGQTSYGLSETLKITPAEAKEFIDRYFMAYPKLKDFMEAIIEQAKTHGYAETLYGRKRYLKEELQSKNRTIREFAKRAAINTPLQGTAADLIKLAMIRLDKKLRNYNSKMLLQVHDELVLEVPKDELDAMIKLTTECMELDQPLKVPLKVDIQYGENWLEDTENDAVIVN